MPDQADELRKLALRSAASALAPGAPPPPFVAVAGGKGGVGATTMAVNLSVAMARQGFRVVLVNADFNQPDATALCNLKEGASVAEVLTGQRTVHEVLQRGPAGIQILPGAWGHDTTRDCTPLAQQRMLAELSRLGLHADLVVLDVGSGLGPIAARFWQAAEMVLVVTTDESTSIMDAYAAIKVLSSSTNFRVGTLVNKVNDETIAESVRNRIQQACQRFLGVSIEHIPHIPFDDQVLRAAESQRPFVLSNSPSGAALAMDALAEQIAASIVSLTPGRRTRVA